MNAAPLSDLDRQIVKDLGAELSRRFVVAMDDITDLVANDNMAFQIILHGAFAVLGAAAGVYHAMNGNEKSADPVAVAQVVLEMMRKRRAENPEAFS